MIDPGEGYRLLDKHEIIREGDNVLYCGSWRSALDFAGRVASFTRLYFRRCIRLQSPDRRWLDMGELLQSGDKGILTISLLMVGQAVYGGDECYSRRIEPAAETIIKPTHIDCGCGKHKVDPTQDLYAQHRKWLEDFVIISLDGPLFFREGGKHKATKIGHVPGIGISARPEVEVLVEIQHWSAV